MCFGLPFGVATLRGAGCLSPLVGGGHLPPTPLKPWDLQLDGPGPQRLIPADSPDLAFCLLLLFRRCFSCFMVSSVQSLSRVQLCNPMNCSMPGLPVHHQLPESTQTHAHRVGDAVQPSHPLSTPSPPAPNPSQHQGLFQ